MSAVSLLSTLREKPTDDSLKNGCKNEGDEDAGSGRGGGDPAVLAMGRARPPLTYTRDELIRLRDSPLVKKGLELLLSSDRLQLVLKKRSESPPNEEDKGGRGDAPTENQNQKGVYGRERRSADPRERVRKESESAGGIVLSPQRRSFTSGCGAPVVAAPPPPLAPTRPQSPLSQPQPAKPDPAGRRIGSGRIMVRDTTAGWEEPEFRPSEPYRPPRSQGGHRGGNNGGASDRFERRSFGRDSYSSDMKRERDDRFTNDKGRDREDNNNRRTGGRYSQRRFEKEDEPEWFSGGPTSQNETIELRGFDESVKKSITSNGKETESAGSNHSNSKEQQPETEKWRETTTKESILADTSNDKDSGVESKPDEQQSSSEQVDFNLDEFLKFDSIPDVLTNGGGESEGGSRFSRWFRRDTPTGDAHYERLLNNMVDDLEASTGQPSPPPATHMFAPISPPPPPAHAAAPAPAHPAPPQHPKLLQLLRRASAATEANNSSAGKIHSLQELEARLRPQQTNAHSDHDLSAFKRLLAQVCGGHAVPAAEPQRQPPQPMSLLQMLNKSMEQQQQQQQQPPHIPQELVYKLLQLQQRQQQQPAPVNEMGNDRELLQRPEAQAILHGLKAGEITVQHLMQQLHNPNLQSRHRELLLTVLTQHQRTQQMSSSPLPGSISNVAPHLVVPPHHQPLRLSPLPHNTGVPARIPSPRELAAHTQSIMQSALIKKKLEEQRENFRRRQEMQSHPKQATPISFTPTSVLRKMTAEKESEPSSNKQAQWSQLKMPQGRPIVKGNQSGAAPSMNYPSQADYQQHYLNQQQQQMMGGVRNFPQNQQRQQQVPTSQFNNMNMRGIPAGTTLHQLLLQSHQRTLNEMGGAGVGQGGGDNQLARWFSPELLARASAGKLPSVHVPNALSLEDLERHHHSPAPPVRN